MAIETSSRVIRESYEPVSSKTEAGGIRREEVEGDDDENRHRQS